jgi:hypothetical protein
MTPKDIEYVAWVKGNEAAIRKGGSISKLSGVLYFVLICHSVVVSFP